MEIQHNATLNRFETIVEDQTALVEYIESAENTLDITHTYVPAPLEGRGIAAALTKAILDYAASNNLKVRPVCPYTAVYISRHPEYEHILA